MASATIFKKFNEPVENKSLIVITKEIKEGKYKNEVEPVTALAQQGNKEGADKLKKKLPAFTPSATFEGGRKLEYVMQYSKFIILDLDNLSQQQIIDVSEKVKTIPFTFSSFKSPSWNGIKIIVEVTTEQEHHEQAYTQIADFYEKELNQVIDRTGKDITRLCFVSYDPDTFRNLCNEKFPVIINGFLQQAVKENTTPFVQPVISNENAYTLQFAMQIAFTDTKIKYEPGNRNKYIYQLACNCNRAGIPFHEAMELCTLQFDLDPKELQASFQSGYKHHTAEFAKFANSANTQSENTADKQQDFLKATPSIPLELYNQLPDILRSGGLAFTEPRERDVFLTGALGILSGCIPNVKGVYAQQQVYPNLFTFTIAPAASGKGALKFAKQLADEYHMHVLKLSKDAEADYQQQAADYKQKMYSRKKGETIAEETPEKPVFRVIFIPANTSYAKILSHLEQNEGSGIICETEADTLGNVFKQEWGSYSDMLRKSFHHERISSSRKTNNEFIEVNAPCLSIALSGTPGQVTGLIASAEDGLFSRFLFYAFKVDQQWNDVSPFAGTINLTDHFSRLSVEVFEMVKFLEKNPTEIRLTREQWMLLNEKCSVWLNDITAFTGEEAASIVKRLGLILYRIAMLLTAMRKFENGELTEEMQCTDTDFQTAAKLAEIYLHHSILMFNNLPKQHENAAFQTGDNKRRFFEALPAQFSRAEAIVLGAQYQMSTRSIDEFLRITTGNLLEKPKPGFYQKYQS